MVLSLVRRKKTIRAEPGSLHGSRVPVRRAEKSKLPLAPSTTLRRDTSFLARNRPWIGFRCSPIHFQDRFLADSVVLVAILSISANQTNATRQYLQSLSQKRVAIEGATENHERLFVILGALAIPRATRRPLQLPPRCCREETPCRPHCGPPAPILHQKSQPSDC